MRVYSVVTRFGGVDMSGETMIIEVDTIAALGSSAGTIATEFEGANAESDTIAAAVGHSGLSKSVHDFAHGWDDKRKKMTDALKAMSQAATAVADTWKDFDEQGADALRGEGEQSGG